MRRPNRHYYEFGPYRLETNERVLLRDGRLVPLTPKAFETLLALVESGGHILDKEELLKKVWPDTFVEEVSLAKKVSILRKVLGEDGDHHYIETIPRRGYRFVADVRETWQEDSTAIELEVANGTSHEQQSTKGEPDEASEALPSSGATGRALSAGSLASAGRWGWLVALLSVSLLAVFGVWQWASRSVRNSSKPALNAIPLTSYRG